MILPSGGNYAEVLGTEGGERIADWVSAGGTLLGIGAAVTYLASDDVDLLHTDRETLSETSDDEEKSKENEKSGERSPGTVLRTELDYRRAIRAGDGNLDTVSGALVQAVVDTEHWLAAGLRDRTQVLFQGDSIFTPLTLDRGVNVLRFAAKEELLASGYLWEENHEQLAYKPFVMVEPRGRGLVIGMTADPNFRAYMDGLNVLLLNAIFRGAAHARPVRRSDH